MTKPPLPSTHSVPKKNGAQRAEWWAFAHHCIARLRGIETEIADLERRAKAGDDDAVDRLLEYDGNEAQRPPSKSGTPPKPSATDLMARVTRARHLSPDHWEAIVADGGDPFATDTDGNIAPAVPLPVPDLILLTRLAATFRNAEGLEESLQPGALTILTGLAPSLQLGKLLVGSLLPVGWTTYNRAPRSSTRSVLQLPDREPAIKDLERCLKHSAPILLPVLSKEDIPSLFSAQDTGARFLNLAPLDADILIAVLSASHSATGRIDEDSVRTALPDDETLAKLDATHLALACRAPTALRVAERIVMLTTATPSSVKMPEEPRPTTIDGTSPAHQAARDIVTDLSAWKDDKIAWSEMPRSLLIHGEPGTGKTYLTRQLALAAGVPLIEGSFAAWQAEGHLGQMLAAMKKSFDDALGLAPCILFVDEIDAVGSRFSSDQHAINYRTQVVNGFLQQIDRLTTTPGVVLIGACNQLDKLDPAIKRAGRFDQIVRMPLPSLQDISRILKKELADTLSTDEIEQLAREVVGMTPAEIDTAVRAAKADVRRRQVRMSLDLLRGHLCLEQPDLALLHRIAVHEAGHALAADLLAPGAVVKITLSSRAGMTERIPPLQQVTVDEIETELLILMSGRAAERLVLGTISGGAGGDASSDLAQASALVLQMDRELGLGRNGDGWLGPARMTRLTDDEKQRIRVKLGQAERRAHALLEPQKDVLLQIADQLLARRELDAAELSPLFAKAASGCSSPPAAP